MRSRKKTSQFKFVVKRSSKTTIVAVCAMIAVCLVTLLVIHAFQVNAEAEREKWRATAQQDEQEKNKWIERNQNVGTEEDFKQIAEENGLVDKDTVIVTPVTPNS